jgi:hypothetical protein
MHRRCVGRRTSIAACLPALVTLLAVTGPSSAPALPVARTTDAMASQRGPFVPPGFVLPSSNGYTIRVTVLSAPPANPGSGPSAFATILVSGQKGAVAYIAPAIAREDSFEVRLGKLGHIAVTFHATEGSRRQRVCAKNQSISVASGYYEGVIAFHGEQGYTEVEALRAEGDASLLLNLVCPAKSTFGTGPGLPGAELRVRGTNPTATPSLTVVENDPQAPVQLEAHTYERLGEIAINRTIRMEAPRTAFDYDSKPRTATLKPPSPFSGTARFRRLGRRKSLWSGNLTVDLPGQAGVHLTGRHLRESLFRARFKGSGPLQ